MTSVSARLLVRAKYIIDMPCRTGELRIRSNCDVAVDARGIIESISPADTTQAATREVEILIPGFVDTHFHAPQYRFTGTGSDMQLLDWLNTYTFPVESKFADLAYARDVYSRSVRAALRNGSTTVMYFATIHLEASKELCRIAAEIGQRALVGKVSMDRNSPEYYCESTERAIADAREFCTWVQKDLNNPLVQPVITPRFVPSCTSELMKGLAQIARELNVQIQSHISESPGEIEWVKALHPDCASYADVYKQHGLLGERTLLAHGVYLKDDEVSMLKTHNVALSHCPLSNFCLGSGVLDMRRLEQSELRLSYGTDVSGGYSPSMLDCLRQAFTASSVTHCMDRSKARHTLRECFFYATMGGAESLGLGAVIGTIDTGKAFDALGVDATRAPVSHWPEDTITETFAKFLTLGDDRNITHIWVQGRQISLTQQQQQQQ